MTKSNNNLFWDNKVPTEPDVKRIRKAYPDDKLEVGQIIPYENIAQIIGSEYRSSRFISVTNAWRKIAEKEMNIFIGTERGKGFKVLNESEKLGLSKSKFRSAGNSIKRSLGVGTVIDVAQLADEEKVQHGHIMKIGGQMRAINQLKKNRPALPTME